MLVLVFHRMEPNECTNLQCQYECLNRDGHESCICPPGYTLNPNDHSCDGKKATFIIVIDKISKYILALGGDPKIF